MNFLEACKNLRDGKCKEIQDENGDCYYMKDGIIKYSRVDVGIFLSPEVFLGRWYIIEVKKKVVIKDVKWNKNEFNIVYPTVIGFNWICFLDKPKMKMTLEWEE